MRSLCHALLGRTEPRPEEELAHFDMERVLEHQAEEQLEKDSLAEFDRYRRMDEWSGSFQNIYARAALHCQMQMMQAKIQELDLMRFVPYTRAGTYDLLRLEAFECLVELDISQSPELLRWLIFTMTTDTSAYVRHHCQRLFGRALAQIAFGRPQQTEPSQTGGLIIEQESSTDVRQADLARRQTVPGAIEALKKEISDDPSLKDYMWAACNSMTIAVLELAELLDVCRVLFDPIQSKRITLRLARHWRVKNLGHGKLHFSRTGPFRGSLNPKRKRDEAGMPPPAPRITFKQSKTGATPSTPSSGFPKLHIPNPSPTPTAGTPTASTPATPASGGGLKLKLKFGQKK
jgi:transcription initiation factor TFIID subunit 2